MEYREDLMAKAPSVRKNYIYNLIYQVMTLITPFITTPYISRVLGADGTGVQSYTNSVVQYLPYWRHWEQLLMGRERSQGTEMT